MLDFANNAEDIVEAFEPYFEATTLADVTDPNIVHETMNKLVAHPTGRWRARLGRVPAEPEHWSARSIG